MEGPLLKMISAHGTPVSYELPVGSARLPMNELIGQTLRFEYSGKVLCIHCGRLGKKSFNQGYCFPCSQKLARCDLCIVRPENCHYAQGTCREPEWGEKNCLIPHVVYLANASGIKVGITREGQIPTRFIDQGASQALPIFRVTSRKVAGLVEVALKEYVSDKTNWRLMLQGTPPVEDLTFRRDEIFEHSEGVIDDLLEEYGAESVTHLEDYDELSFQYPVSTYPSKISSLDLEKENVIESQLLGIKGQYLLLEKGVMNIRKHTGFEVKISYH